MRKRREIFAQRAREIMRQEGVKEMREDKENEGERGR